MTEIPITLLADDLICGYLVEEPTGSDSVAEFYTALHVQLEIRRTLKVIRPELYQHNEAFRTHFLQEMQQNVRFQHKKLRNISEVGWDETRDLLFYVTALPDGQKLSDRLAGGKSLPEDGALKIVRDLTEILREREISGGGAHRKIDPENIFLKNDELVLLNEPGITLPEHCRTAEKELRNPYYAAPEVLNAAGKADLRSDLFSIGAVWAAMLTGQLNFDRNVFPEPEKYGLHLSSQAKALLNRMLDPDPAKRPASPTELLAELDRLPDGLALENQKLQELTLQTIDETVSDRIRTLAADMQKKRRLEELFWKGGIIALGCILALLVFLTLFAGCHSRAEQAQNRQLSEELQTLQTELQTLQEQEQMLKKACLSYGSTEAKK